MYLSPKQTALYGDGEGGALSASADDSPPNTGGYFYFEVTGLTSTGQSINIVIPRLAPLPFNSVSRKYDATLGWRDYEEDANKTIYSAQGAPGECPALGSAQYSSGLSSGDYCVQLLIEDGGGALSSLGLLILSLFSLAAIYKKACETLLIWFNSSSIPFLTGRGCHIDKAKIKL